MAEHGRKKTASATGQKGSIGETFVKGVFEEMQWGPVPVSEHDTGSDFFVQVRDEALTELGLILGVQVKNEKEYFTGNTRDRAKAAGGWEYKAKQEDTEYWIDHAIPHVLVLYDQQNKAAYWGHVTREAVRWTRKGARIRVPCENSLDLSKREQLLSIAAESRRSIAWSPTGWKGVAAMPPARRLRTALLAPRVAAARGTNGTTLPETALARVMLGKFPDRPRRPKQDLPSDEEQREGPFAWKVHRALLSYLNTGELDALSALGTSASEGYERIALLAMRAAVEFERGDPRAALTILDQANDADLVDPVDRAWLDAHRSRCLLELGDVEAARELALQVAATGLLHAHDHGAVALRAAVLSNLLTTVYSPPEDVALAMTAADSPPVWWRDQHRAWALTEVLDYSYRKWADRGVSGGRTDTDAWDRLRGVTLSAGMNADHRAWRVAASELARYELISGPLDDHDRVAMCLDDLRNCGEKEAVSLAVNRLLLEGPLEPLRSLTQRSDAAASTRTNLTSTLEVFKGALDVLDDTALESHVGWVLQQLRHPDEMPTTDQPFSWIAKDYLLPTLQDAYRLLAADTQALIRRHLVTVPPVEDQLLAEKYAVLVRSLPHDAWTEEEIRTIQSRAFQTPTSSTGETTPFGDHLSLGRAFNAVLAHAGDAERLGALYALLAEGNWHVLEDLGELGAIPDEVVRPLVPHLIRDLDERADQAVKGIFRLPAIYSGEVLLIINCTHPSLAQWDPIQRVLEDGGEWDQAKLARRLSDQGDRIDQDIIERLRPALVKIADERKGNRFFDPKSDEAARIALLELTTRSDDPANLHAALAAGPFGRKAVAHAVGRRRGTSDLSLLAALATDSDYSVRAAAAGAAATWQQYDPHPTVQVLLDALLQEGGYANAYATMRAIKHKQHNQVLHGILTNLSNHPSARIRWRAIELLRDPENCRCGGL